jgi:hypothetical protein
MTQGMNGIILTEALSAVSMHDACAKQGPLKRRVTALAPQQVQDCLGVFVATACWQTRHRFDVVRGTTIGTPAVIVLYVDEYSPEVADLVAFHPDRAQAATLLGKAWALGAYGAFYDATHFNNGRIRVCADLWSWLEHQGQCLLVLDWKEAAKRFVERKIRSVSVTDYAARRFVEKQLRDALRPPFVQVDKIERAAA